MKTELIGKRTEEDANVGHLWLSFFSKDKIDITTHLLYDMKDEKQVAAFGKARAFFKIGSTYNVIFKEPEEVKTAPAAEAAPATEAAK